MRLPPTESLRRFHASADGQATSLGRTRSMTREAPEEHPLMKTSDPAAAALKKVRRFMRGNDTASRDVHVCHARTATPAYLLRQRPLKGPRRRGLNSELTCQCPVEALRGSPTQATRLLNPKSRGLVDRLLVGIDGLEEWGQVRRGEEVADSMRYC